MHPGLINTTCLLTTNCNEAVMVAVKLPNGTSCHYVNLPFTEANLREFAVSILMLLYHFKIRSIRILGTYDR
jgi:hypothetical protein